jgi:Type-1V conjugative transfer system mating pair stabilisation
VKKLKLITFPILTIFTIIPLLAFADAISDARQLALDFGATYKDSATSAITAQNKSNTPGYTTDNPEQTKYYNGTSTDADAQAKIQSSSEGDLMSNGLVNRPKMTINPNDSFLNTGKAIEGNPDQVVAMLTGTYAECKPLTFTQTENDLHSCDKYVEPNCVDGSKLVSVSGGPETSFNYPYLQVDISRRGGSGCTKYYANSNIYIKDVSRINSFTLLSIRWDDVIEIKLNGNVVFANGSFGGRGCERAIDFYVTPNYDLKPYLINGDNKIELTLGIGGMGNATARYQIDYAKDRVCNMVDTCVNIPSKCSFQSSKCLNFSTENICNYTQNIYSCATTTTTSTANVTCGSNVYCINGQCTKVEADSDTKDFVKSISYLQALNQMGKDSEASADNVKIFTGTKNSCDKDAVSYNNCCKDSGWGQDYLGASCKENEIALMKSQEKKLCHYVGSYCSKKIPIIGTCQTTTKSYCCFGSKISRVINEQGKAQLGIGWGSGASPDCRGLTANELQNLKFDTMDLSEITSDIASQASPPSQSYIEGKVKQTVEAYGKKSSN